MAQRTLFTLAIASATMFMKIGMLIMRHVTKTMGANKLQKLENLN